jgi:hypothetical protein
MTTFEAAIAFAPCTTLDRLNDPVWSQRQLYDGGGLRLLPSRGEKFAPVLCDHDAGQVMGRFEKMLRLDDNGPWMTAIATLTKCPPWLKRGTPASFAFIAPIWDSFGNNIVRRAIVREVSVLSPGVEPAEPGARVLYVKPAEAPKPKPNPTTVIRHSVAPAARQIRPADEIDELHRRMEWLGSDVPMEVVLENLKRELEARPR